MGWGRRGRTIKEINEPKPVDLFRYAERRVESFLGFLLLVVSLLILVLFKKECKQSSVVGLCSTSSKLNQQKAKLSEKKSFLKVYKRRGIVNCVSSAEDSP